MTITTTDPNRALWEARARGEETPTWESLTSEPDGIEQDTVDVPAGQWLRPADAVTGPVVLAIHGGGFVSGSVATHRRMFGHLARAAGVDAGVDVHLDEFAGQVHTLQMGAGRTQVADDAIGKAGSWLRSTLMS